MNKIYSLDELRSVCKLPEDNETYIKNLEMAYSRLLSLLPKEGEVVVPVKRLLAARNALINDNCNEAYHQIYMCADETTENKNFPWAHWEAMIEARPK